MQESDKLKNWKKPLNRKGGSTLKRRDKMPEGKVRIMIYLPTETHERLRELKYLKEIPSVSEFVTGSVEAAVLKIDKKDSRKGGGGK